MSVLNKTIYTEDLIQKRLSNYFMSPNNIKYIAENPYLYGWESDLWIMTKSDVTYEFEIKISKADFKNDFKHKTDKHQLFEGKYKNLDGYTPKYYSMLEKYKNYSIYDEERFVKFVDEHPEQYKYSEIMLPTYFYYAVPENLVTEDEVPEYSGLIYMISYYPYFKIVKTAPKLTTKKNTVEGLNLTDKFYYNYRDWRTKAGDEKEKTDKVKEQLNEVVNKPENEKLSYFDLMKKYEKEKESHEYWEECWSKKSKELDYANETIRENLTYTRKLIKILQEHNIDFRNIIENDEKQNNIRN